MKYASGEFDSKIQFARKFAGTMAYLLVNQGDAAGLSCCDDKLHLELPPSRRPAHLQNFFEVLGELEPKGETGLVDALHTVAEKVGQRAFIFILSDLFCDPDALGDALQHLRYRKHDVAVFHLMDPQEIDFDFTRPTSTPPPSRNSSSWWRPGATTYTQTTTWSPRTRTTRRSSATS